MRSTDLAFHFFGKRKSDKLDYIQVNFKGKDNDDYEKACEYSIENGLGDPIAMNEKEILWNGWELSVTDYGILFIRRYA